MPSPARIRTSIALALACCAATTACSGGGGPPAPAERTAIVATTYPLAYFAGRLAGPEVEVLLPLESGADPLHWHPSREQLEAFGEAALVVANGAGVEDWLGGIGLPARRVVHTADVFESEWIETPELTHSHGAGDHSHAGTDGHTWLDPLNAVRQVESLAAALARTYPQHAPLVRDRTVALIADLERLDARWSELVPRLDEVRLLASHPAYDYLARRYGFELENFDLDPAAALDDATRAALGGDDGRPGLMMWESSPAPETALELEQLGIASVVFSPVENPGPEELRDGDYLTRMLRNLDDLAAALP